MDDFATNCTILDFPKMIASIRSRNISTMLMIQAESQLTEQFGYDAKTIIGNCDTYVYLGGNDIETARTVAERCDVPLKKILNMPVGTNWIFRRGQAPVNGVNFNLNLYLQGKKLAEQKPSLRGKEERFFVSDTRFDIGC
jgi:type IV secretion system protein VirD4